MLDLIQTACIDQKCIRADLQCLPILLAACNLLLVVSGSTFLSRLWCCVEVFVYVTMSVEDEYVEMPMIITIGKDDEEHAHVRDLWRHFDAATCMDPARGYGHTAQWGFQKLKFM